MKQLLLQYAAYHIWANQKLMDTILPLDEEQHRKEVPSSFKSLYLTVMHMWDSESAWWQRLKLQEKVILPGENFTGGMRDAWNGLMQQSQLFQNWVTNASDLSIDHVFAYQNSKKEMFKQPVHQVLMHVFNHGTYNRGQLVNILRQLGIEKIPATDYIVWTRKKV